MVPKNRYPGPWQNGIVVASSPNIQYCKAVGSNPAEVERKDEII